MLEGLPVLRITGTGHIQGRTGNCRREATPVLPRLEAIEWPGVFVSRNHGAQDVARAPRTVALGQEVQEGAWLGSRCPTTEEEPFPGPSRALRPGYCPSGLVRPSTCPGPEVTQGTRDFHLVLGPEKPAPREGGGERQGPQGGANASNPPIPALARTPALPHSTALARHSLPRAFFTP